MAEGIDNVTFERADAQVHPFEAGAFDVAISRFGAMFFSDPVAAFANIGRALRPGGRVALMTWQPLAENEWVTALRSGGDGPDTAGAAGGHARSVRAGRSRPSPRILHEAGYLDIDFATIREPFHVGTDTEDAFSFVRASPSFRDCSKISTKQPLPEPSSSCGQPWPRTKRATVCSSIRPPG